MLDRVAELWNSVDWQTLLEHVSNEKILAALTHPYGLAAIGVLMLVSLFMKWRVTFAVLAGGVGVAFLGRYATAGQGGPNRQLFLFAAGAVAVGAFLIYYLFIRED